MRGPPWRAHVDGIVKGVSSVASSCEALAASVEQYAAQVEKTQQSIRDLCDRLGSIGGIVGTFFEFIKGHGLDEVHEIADEIKTVIAYFGSETDATLQLLESAKQSVGSWVVDLEKSANKQFMEFFGEPAGAALSSQFNRVADSAEGAFRWGTGFFEGIAALDPTRFASDPAGARQTWEGLDKFGRLIINPVQQVLDDPHGSLETLKGLVHAEDWSKDRPMLCATEVGLDVVSAALPIAKTGALGKARALEGSGETNTALRGAGPGGGGPPPVSDVAKNAAGAAEALDDLAKQPISSTLPAGGRPVSLPEDATPGPPPVAKTPESEPQAELAAPPSQERAPATAAENAVAPGRHPTEPARASEPTAPEHSPGSVSNGTRDGGGAPAAATEQQEASTAAAATEEIQRSSAATQTGTEPVGELPAKPGLPGSAEADSGGSFPDAGERLPAADDGAADARATENGAGVSDETGGPDTGRHIDNDSHGHDVASESETVGINDAYQNTNGVPIGKDLFDEILATDKGKRPDPDTYLPPEYIREHMRSFDSGSSRIFLRESYEEYGIGKPDTGRTEFVLTSETASKMIAEVAGDPVRLAERLGIPADQLAGDSLVMVEFHPTDAYKAAMPSGNEWGANAQWLPGGRLPHGDLEAVVETEDMINGVHYTVIDLITGEVL